MSRAQRWSLIAALLAQAGLYALWLGNGRHAAAALLVFALPPALLALATFSRWRHAGYCSSVVALGWFSHGVMRAWTDHPHSMPAWAALLLALLIITVASGPAARARLASRRARHTH